MPLLFRAEVTVVLNTFQVFMAGGLYDLCRWHVIFTEGLNPGLPIAMIVEFIVLKDPLPLTFLS